LRAFLPFGRFSAKADCWLDVEEFELLLVLVETVEIDILEDAANVLTVDVKVKIATKNVAMKFLRFSIKCIVIVVYRMLF
jgi:hypothetical protein